MDSTTSPGSRKSRCGILEHGTNIYLRDDADKYLESKKAKEDNVKVIKEGEMVAATTRGPDLRSVYSARWAACR